MEKKFLMENFDDIRCFTDSEYLEVAERLAKVDVLMSAIKLYHPELTPEHVRTWLLSCQSIIQFQKEIVSSTILKAIEETIKDISFENFENIEKNKHYVFVSNHRDIVLDSAFINYGLIHNGFDGCEIAIGSNLLEIPWVKDLVRLNRSFVVQRNLPKQEMLAASIKLSSYIQYVLNEKKQSVWIAQREGRAKDGNDKTNPGLLKMFVLSAKTDLFQHLMNMNIMPVSISYEYDPCDAMKLHELMAKANGETYVKKPNEDYVHILTGIQGLKGNVKLSFCTPLNKKILQLSTIQNRNELLKNVAQILDEEIHQHYQLWPNNYISYDLLNNGNMYSAHYTENEKNDFIGYVTKKLKSVELENNEQAYKILLEMYANPLKNKFKLT